MTLQTNADTLVTIFGGSGFLGRHVVRALAKRRYRIRVAVRRPELANFLQPLGSVGQIHAVQANVRYPRSIEAAARGSNIIINLVAILHERGAQRFDVVHAGGAERVALAAAAFGARMIHVSAIGADPRIRPRLMRAPRRRGKQSAFAAVPGRVIFRPSVLFGPEDDFFNRFAAMARFLPALPLVGGGLTKFQPVFVGDVAEAIALAVDGKARPGHDLRARRAGNPQLQAIDGVCADDHRSQAPSDAAAVRACEIAGVGAAIPAQAAADARSGRVAQDRQYRVGDRRSAKAARCKAWA